VAIVFFAFRIMVGIGIAMLGVVVLGLILRARKMLFATRWFLLLCIGASPLGFVAVIAGWVTAEVGRQPWTVYGLMRTADSVTPSLTGADVAASLLGYAVVYLILFPAGIYAMARIVAAGPSTPELQAAPVEGGRAKPATRATQQEERP
jgi:cytochrome d ubiquinol oxidase subunit I